MKTAPVRACFQPKVVGYWTQQIFVWTEVPEKNETHVWRPEILFFNFFVLRGFLSVRQEASSGWWRKEKACRNGRYLRVYWVNDSVQPILGGPSAWGCDAWLGKFFLCENRAMEVDLRFVTGNVRFVSGNVRFVTGNVRLVSVSGLWQNWRSTGSLGMQEVRWDKGGTEHCFCVWNRKKKHQLETWITVVVHCRNKILEVASGRMSHVVLTGRWWYVLLSSQVPTGDKRDNSKDSLCENLAQFCDWFPKC